MPTLSASDAERLLRFVAEAEQIDGDHPFPPELLRELGTIVEADWVTYCELDRVRRRVLSNIDRPGDNEDEEDVDQEVFWQIVVEEHPVCVQHQRGVFKALKVTDFLTPTQLRSSRLYDTWFRPLGVENELTVPIPSPLWHTKTFLFDRGGRQDFTERDRLMLDLLQPRFAQLWQAAKTRRMLRVALGELEQMDEQESRGILLLNAAGDVEFASPPARRLLRDFFGTESRAVLPAELASWLEATPKPTRFVRRQGTRKLTVERTADALLLNERHVEVDLTAREREVLAWVARGKTNAQIAELLWLAPSTVRKHLENVYAKLGVSTRTAAVARFLGLLDAEVS